jgi:sugar lactone lactonase YvrE
MIQKLIAVLFLVGIILGIGYLLNAPVEIEPVAWTPPNPPGATGLYRPNGALSAIQRLGEGMGRGPEDVAVDGQGRIYTGVEDGTIIRMARDGTGVEPFANTDGRPLGIAFGGATLFVADAYRGLLAINTDGEVTVVSSHQGGTPFLHTNDVDVARDGTVYFTDSSSRFGLEDYRLDLLEHRPNGRLLAYDPTSGETTLVADGLYFANGVAVSADQRSVLVVETGKYRVRRVSISGDNAGNSEVVLENLPGFPDNISATQRGYWLALSSPRDANMDQSLLPSPFMRRMILRLPPSYLPQFAPLAYVIQLDADAKVVGTLQDPRAGYGQITSVQQVGNALYFGSTTEGTIGRLQLP